MGGPEYAGFGSEDFEPEDVLWSPGIDYVEGWRRATDVGAELLTALKSAGLDGEGVSVQGHSAADGSGVVRLRLPVATARAVAELIRATEDGGSVGRAAS